MIDFEILENGETKYLSWAKLCKHMGVTPYMPSTWELVGLKKQFAKQWNIPIDDIQVRVDRSAIL